MGDTINGWESLLYEIEHDHPPKPRTGRKDYHKVKKRKHGEKGRELTKWQRRRIIAWDGEGTTLQDGTHIYNMLTNSNGDRLIVPEGISTLQAFNFLLDHNDHLAINVIFGGSYDVNMILRDLSRTDIDTLWTDGKCSWHNYRIYYSNRKRFSIRRVTLNPHTGKYVQDGKGFVLWDVLGFFQTNFVSSCRKWLGDDLPILDMIERMKASRSEFTGEQLEEILKYNEAENKLLVLLMQKLLEAFDTCGLRLKRYDGAGAVAGALLERAQIKEHKGSWDGTITYATQCAYGGGRIEAVKVGNQETGPIYGYDIVSAYPSVAMDLPSFKDATYVEATEWDRTDTSLVTVMFNFERPMDGSIRDKDTPEGGWINKRTQPFYPLWVRDLDGSIYYPPAGYGTYWGNEIRNLYKYYEEGRDFIVMRVWNLQLPYGDVRPFAFIKDAFRHRRIFKRQGNMAHEALKLGLNSIYGKLAQQAGYRNNRVPTYHQLMWAGMITSGCRAKMFDAAMQDPEAVIFFATDGLYTTRPLQLHFGTNLGEWEEDVYDGITVVQAGIYWLKGHSEEWQDVTPWKSKYRGFDKGTLDRDAILKAWDNGQTTYEAYSTRFVGMGGALMADDFNTVWRHWLTTPRDLSLIPDTKRYVKETTCFSTRLCDTMAAWPVALFFGDHSRPYPLLWRDEYMAEVGREIIRKRTIHDEEDDSYE
jgi:hypothetical protein